MVDVEGDTSRVWPLGPLGIFSGCGPVSVGTVPPSCSLVLIARAMVKKASSTFLGSFAEVSMNGMPNSFAKASPRLDATVCTLGKRQATS